MPLSEPQILIAKSTARFRTACCGRRFGKTTLAIREMAKKASQPKKKIYYIAPTYRMAKEIVWTKLKEKLLFHKWVRGKPNESELSITIKNASMISLRGADNPDSLRGVGLDLSIFDEFDDIKPEAWFEIIRPTLSDTGGSAIFLGTPKGRKLLHEFYMKGKDASEPEWDSWQFTTLDGGNVPVEEIETARRELDELTFNQEYLADFVNFSGRAYYPFMLETHTSNDLIYDPKMPLVFCFDFNVEPGVSVICQEQTVKPGVTLTGIIDEVYIPRNSNTNIVCDKLIEKYKHHAGYVYCYGDATGGAKGSAKIMGSDWELIRQKLRPVFGDRLIFKVDKANPPERSRVNAMNSRLQSASGDIKMIASMRAKQTIKDLEGVCIVEGGSGQIDKKKDMKLTHLTDALGYYISKEFPISMMRSKIVQAMY